jgi:hypothetical protein
MTTWDLFLAYPSPERPRARDLYDTLVARGLKVFMDEKVLVPGDNWMRQLPAYLRDSEVIVALVSKHSEDAWYQESEMVLAVTLVREENRRIVPVLLEKGVDVHYGSQQLQAIPWYGGEPADDIAGLLAGVVP